MSKFTEIFPFIKCEHPRKSEHRQKYRIPYFKAVKYNIVNGNAPNSTL